MTNLNKVTAEVHFAQLLASNQKYIRDRTLKRLNKWFESKSYSDSAFTEDGMLKLWKGLYYYFWNLDKPLAQEDMANVISGFLMSFRKIKYAFLFIDTFFQTMIREWFAIDRYRLEKFMMFTRKFLNKCFQFLKQQNWNLKCMKHFKRCFIKTVANTDNSACCLGFKLHVVDIYMEELAKVAAKDLMPNQTKFFLVPYCKLLATCENPTLLKSVQKNIFFYLLNQEANPEVFTDFPILKFNAKSVCKLLRKHLDSHLSKMNHKIITDIIYSFEESNEGEANSGELYQLKKCNPPIRKRAIKRAAEDLLLFDEDFIKEKQNWKKNTKSLKLQSEV